MKILTILSIMAVLGGVSHAQDFSFLWRWDGKKVQNLESKGGQDLDKGHDCLLLQISFRFGKKDQTDHSNIAAFPQHESLKLVTIGNLQITKSIGCDHALVRQVVKDDRVITTLIEAKSQGDFELEGTANLYFENVRVDLRNHAGQPEERTSRGNCFKCSGTGKLGSWCTFCHGFMAWCKHGGCLYNCNACSGIGWIETWYQRCPKCYGKGYLGSWCTFCHGHMIWCIHGGRWYNCGTCGGKGAIPQGYSTCSRCNGRGWIGSYCCFCYATVVWCVHGHSPVTCPNCGGKGCIKN